MDHFTNTVDDAARYERMHGEAADIERPTRSECGDIERPRYARSIAAPCGCTHESNSPTCPHGGCDFPF